MQMEEYEEYRRKVKEYGENSPFMLCLLKYVPQIIKKWESVDIIRHSSTTNQKSILIKAYHAGNEDVVKRCAKHMLGNAVETEIANVDSIVFTELIPYDARLFTTSALIIKRDLYQGSQSKITLMHKDGTKYILFNCEYLVPILNEFIKLYARKTILVDCFDLDRDCARIIKQIISQDMRK
jgi:hypothetical protein